MYVNFNENPRGNYYAGDCVIRAVNMSAMRESQTAQTAQILQGQTAEVDALYNRLKNCPVNSVPVYGSQPIFTCPQNNSCGCGCNGSF